ncbi:MAG: AMP-binding protein, partial [Clostridia bacterium]
MFKNRKTNYPLYDIRPLDSLRQLVDEGAQMYSEKAAFKFRENKEIKSVSYKELKIQADSLGTALCVLGLEDKHIAIIGNNCYDWALSYLSVLLSSGVVVPVDKDLPIDDIKYILQYSDCSAVIYSKSCEEKVDLLLEELPDITHYICMGEPAAPDDVHYNLYDLVMRGKKLLLGGDKRFFDLEHNLDELKELLFTSGTTGKSKGVMLSEHILCFNIENSQKMMWISDTCLSVLPYHHAYESTCGILTMMHHGMTICINETLRTLMPNFKVYKPTEVQLVPLFLEKMYRTIWDKIEEKGKTKAVKALIKTSNGLLKAGIDMRSIFFKDILATFGGNCKSIICGGAQLKPYLPFFFTSMGITLINGYGISECGPLVTVNRPEFHDYESVGLPLPGVELRIDNPNESGEGEICVKGANVMLGYYKNHDDTAK